MSVGTSDGQNTQHFEEEIDHIMNNPIEHDFDALKSGRKPIQEPTPEPKPDTDIGLGVNQNYPRNILEDMGRHGYGYYGDKNQIPPVDHTMGDVHRKVIQQKIEDILFPNQPSGPYEKGVVPGQKSPHFDPNNPGDKDFPNVVVQLKQ